LENKHDNKVRWGGDDFSVLLHYFSRVSKQDASWKYVLWSSY